MCTTFWSVQFNAVRQAFMNPQISNGHKDSTNNDIIISGLPISPSSNLDIEKSYIRSLATSFAWAASGGKSGASFSRTSDDRFVIKCISRTELQMFLDCAPAYFEVRIVYFFSMSFVNFVSFPPSTYLVPEQSILSRITHGSLQNRGCVSNRIS